jgi:hypothetical protein
MTQKHRDIKIRNNKMQDDKSAGTQKHRKCRRVVITRRVFVCGRPYSSPFENAIRTASMLFSAPSFS